MNLFKPFKKKPLYKVGETSVQMDNIKTYWIRTIRIRKSKVGYNAPSWGDDTVDISIDENPLFHFILKSFQKYNNEV